VGIHKPILRFFTGRLLDIAAKHTLNLKRDQENTVLKWEEKRALMMIIEPVITRCFPFDLVSLYGIPNYKIFNKSSLENGTFP
jgi:hypothetical protein